MTGESSAQMTLSQRLRYFFADTWWRIAWLAVAIAWCVGVNWVVIANHGDFTWWGPLSVIPLFAFVGDMLRRDAALRRSERAR